MYHHTNLDKNNYTQIIKISPEVKRNVLWEKRNLDKIAVYQLNLRWSCAHPTVDGKCARRSQNNFTLLHYLFKVSLGDFFISNVK
jgi:hypothetical protein